MVARRSKDFTPDPTLQSALHAAVMARAGTPERDEIRFRCPNPDHPDQHPSARWNPATFVWRCDACHAGGGALDLARLLGITAPATDSSGARTVKTRPARTAENLHGRWVYQDADGTPLIEVHKYVHPVTGDKDFPTFPAGQPKERLGKTKRVLYRLPDLLAASPNIPVFLCEGEKDADNVAALGLLATTNVGGALNWREEYTATLADRHVVILQDNDAPGQNRSERLVKHLLPVAKSVRVLRLPNLPEKGDVSDWIEMGGTREELLNLAKDCPKAEGEVVAVETDAVNTIYVTKDRQLVTERCVNFLLTNDPPLLFQKDRLLVVISRDGALRKHRVKDRTQDIHAPFIRQASPDTLLNLVARAEWRKYTAEGRDMPALPPPWVAGAIEALLEWPFPRLRGISTFPLMDGTGALTLTPGYDEASEYYYEPSGLILPPIPEHPTTDDVKAAMRMVREPFADYPFVGIADKAAVLAALFSMLLRHRIHGNVPVFVVTAPEVGSGKTMLTDLISIITLGDLVPKTVLSDRREEQRKQLLAICIEGTPMWCYDNVDSSISSSELAAIITAGVIRDRLLGASRNVEARVSTIFFATGNNLTLSIDMLRRALVIALDAKSENPFERRGPDGKGWRHEDLCRWTKLHRGEILAALYTLLRAYFQAGAPPVPADRPPMGSFEEWSAVVRGAVYFCMGEDPYQGFNTNRTSVDSQERDHLVTFYRAWDRLYGDQALKASEVKDYLDHCRDRIAESEPAHKLAQELRRAIMLICNKPVDAPIDTRWLGSGLSRIRGKWADGKSLQCSDKRTGDGMRWSLTYDKDYASPPGHDPILDAPEITGPSLAY